MKSHQLGPGSGLWTEDHDLIDKMLIRLFSGWVVSCPVLSGGDGIGGLSLLISKLIAFSV